MENFKINQTEIRTLRGVSDFFRRNPNINLNQATLHNIESGYKLIEMHSSLGVEHFISALQVIQSKDMSGHKVRDNVKELAEHFNGSRFRKYVNYRMKNKTDSNSSKFFLLKWGSKMAKKKRDENYNNRITPYMVEYWTNKGCSKKEALVEIEKFKSEKATSLEGFVARHGKEAGEEMFQKFQQTSKHTKEKYINNYGKEKGSKLWRKYLKTKKETSVFRAQYWINKGYGEEEAEEMRKEFHAENLNTSSVDYWMRKGLTKKDAISKVEEIFSKKQVYFGNASKESLVLLQPLYDKLSPIFQVYLGIECSKELVIYDEECACMRFYDFAIPEKKIIIEYHGERYHPNPKKLTKQEWGEWESWRLSGRGVDRIKMTANEIYKIDKRKKELALNKGYDYLELWSSDSKKINKRKIKEFLIKNGIK